MSLSVADQRTGYPLASYAYSVTVGSDPMSFSEVSGLVHEYQVLTYRHGLSFWEGGSITKFRYDKYVPLTLKKGLIAGAGCKAVYAWLDAVDKRPMRISLCDVHATDPNQPLVAVVTWRIQHALIVKLEAPTLQAQSNDAVIETLTLMVSGLSIETH
jgi:phage tail-like protein